MSEGKIFLGFEVPSGEPVFLSLHHLAIFGMTQLSGKTTTLEALISRSGLKAIAFKTKRGEAGFTTYNLVTPYYKPRADWQFVEGLVNVALGEKVKYEPGMRYGIMKVCKGRKDLKEIQNAAKDFADKTKREFMKAVYEKLVAYLDIVIPELDKWIFSAKLELSEGVNVMDLSAMRLETQHLVIASTIEYAFSNLDHVIVIIPEAWESIPQGKMTPVKWVAQQFIRKGAAVGNYMFLDSQDIGGIDKTPLRQCDNWLMGRMKEAHEVERILKQLLGLKVPKEEIQTLPLGHFYAAIGNVVKKVYVLPTGVPEDVGRKVAMGEMTPEYVRDHYLKVKVMEVNDLVYKEKYEELLPKYDEAQRKIGELLAEIGKPREHEKKLESLEEANRLLREEIHKKDDWLDQHGITAETPKRIQDLEKELAFYRGQISREAQLEKHVEELKNRVMFLEIKTEEAMKQIDKDREDLKLFDELQSVLRRMLPQPTVDMSTVNVPSEIAVIKEQPAITVQKRTPPLTLNDSSLEGKIAIIYAEGKLPKDKWFTVTDVTKAFVSHGWPKDPRTSKALDQFCQWGYLEKQMSGRRPDYKIKLSPEDARGKGLLKEVEAW